MPAFIANAPGNMTDRPPPLQANLVLAVLTVAWIYLRLFLFQEWALPLTYVIPLMGCLWSQRAWHIWTMAGIFLLTTLLHAAHYIGQAIPEMLRRDFFYRSTYVNIFIGAVVVHLALHFQRRLREHATLITSQHAELEAQTEELARQNEEIESQTEELTRQNDELQSANDRLGVREEMLQELLQSSHHTATEEAALTHACQRALRILGLPADHIALLRIDGPAHLTLAAQAGAEGLPPLPEKWPLADSLAGLVLREDKTAYVADFAIQPALAAPFAHEDSVRSLLATPLHVEQIRAGVLVACSRDTAHWSDEQFQLLEWIAAQCSRILESIRWRRALTARTEELHAANRAKDDFLAMLSHELRTPLTPVLAAAGVLAEDHRLPPDVREDLLMIRNNITIQSRLIDDLLDLTRIERGKLDLNRQPFALAPLLRDAVAIVAPDLDANEQTISIQSDVPVTCRIFGDVSRIQQVLWNLLQNAIKFSPLRSRITLAARLQPGPPPRVVITVDDEGRGISPADADRVFKPFEQIRQDRRGGGETGLGLGLAIAKAILEQHDGHITVGPNPLGRGSRFTVDLPLSLAAAPVAETAATRPARTESPPEPGASILLVEDHFDTGRVIGRVLKGAGHDVILARDATEALRHFARGKFDLIISDLGLPDESGLVLMKKIRELQPNMPGLCMSGYGMESDLQACKDVGFSEHLTKPVDVQRLLAAIKRTLHRTRCPAST